MFLRDESGLDDDIYTVHADGSGLKRLTNTPTRDELNPAWSPDGSKILFAGCGVNGGCQLYTIKPEGSHEQQLTFGSFGPPPSAPYLESFNKNTINAAAWTVFGPASSNSAALVNQELEMTLGATATNDPALGAFGIQAASRCLLEGDFDMQVDYRLLEWPFGNGAQAALAAEEPASFVGEVDRINSGGNDFYTAFSSAAFNATPTADFSGTLRLVRSGGTSTAYFSSGANWVPVLTTAVPTDDTSSPSRPVAMTPRSGIRRSRSHSTTSGSTPGASTRRPAVT